MVKVTKDVLKLFVLQLVDDISGHTDYIAPGSKHNQA